MLNDARNKIDSIILYVTTLRSRSLFSSLHLKAAKLIHKLPSETPDSDVLDLVKWKPLGYIYKRTLASIMYQVFHNSLPDQLTALFETRNTDNTYNVRRINDFSHVRYNCNLGRNSVRYVQRTHSLEFNT